MMATLRVLLGGLGVSAVLICLAIVLAGPTPTALAFEQAYDTAAGWHGPDSPPWPPTMDSELRFYAPFWGAYGIVLLAAAADVHRHAARVPWLAAVFFAGGVGRAIAWAEVGAPHPFFRLLMAIELLLPPVMLALLRGGARHRRRGLI